jgi:hypothetical protein
MSLSSDRYSETWVPAPAGLATMASATETLRRAGRSEFVAICLFALIGLTATLVAAVAFGPAFDYGGLLAVAG